MVPQSAHRARPVLYLDIDDTIVAWHEGRPHPAPGAGAFLTWALARLEVRWLTSWAPSGRMEPELVRSLSQLTGLPEEQLRVIRGLDWRGGSKLDGIAWLEHVALGRPFLWVEDSTVPEPALDFLRRNGYARCFRGCDVTREPGAIERLHRELALAYR